LVWNWQPRGEHPTKHAFPGFGAQNRHADVRALCKEQAFVAGALATVTPASAASNATAVARGRNSLRRAGEHS
jgi:hypothetical protein